MIDFLIFNCTLIAKDAMKCGDEIFTHEETDPLLSVKFYRDLGIVVGLVLAAALTSGLTMGLLSLDPLHLRVLSESGTPSEKAAAKNVLPLISRHHQLLVTLLLSNALFAEALPLFLDRLVGTLLAIVISVTCILVFREIIPHSISAKYGLQIGSFLRYIVWTMMILLSPICFPIACLLDLSLGQHHESFYRRDALKTLVTLHERDPKHFEDGLSGDEVKLIRGTLDFKKKKANEIMVSIDDMFMLDERTAVTRGVLNLIHQTGHSRIPIFRKERKNIVGSILVKE